MGDEKRLPAAALYRLLGLQAFFITLLERPVKLAFEQRSGPV
jgi:hypothetical protein